MRRHTLGSLGYLAHRSGQHDHALSYHLQALTLYRATGHTYADADLLDRFSQTRAQLPLLPARAWDDRAMSSPTNPAARPRPEKIDEIRALLREILDDLADRSPEVWGATFDSPAAREITSMETEPRADGTPWGSAPLESVWKTAELLYAAALEFARATQALLVPPFRAWAPAVQARAALEAAAQAWWLLDPSIVGRGRIGRLFLLRYADSKDLEDAHRYVGAAGPITAYGKPRRRLESEADLLQLQRVGGTECEDETLTSDSRAGAGHAS